MKIHLFFIKITITNLSWASDILNHPASRSPLWAYFLHLSGTHVRGRKYNPFDDPIGTTTTQDPECTNPNARSPSSYHSIRLKRVHLVLTDLSHFHGSAFALHKPRVGNAPTNTNANTFGSIIRALLAPRVGDAAGVDGDMRHASAAARLPGVSHHAANGHGRLLLGRYAH
jgi:hypothetical protein